MNDLRSQIVKWFINIGAVGLDHTRIYKKKHKEKSALVGTETEYIQSFWLSRQWLMGKYIVVVCYSTYLCVSATTLANLLNVCHQFAVDRSYVHTTENTYSTYLYIYNNRWWWPPHCLVYRISKWIFVLLLLSGAPIYLEMETIRFRKLHSRVLLEVIWTLFYFIIDLSYVFWYRRLSYYLPPLQKLWKIPI